MTRNYQIMIPDRPGISSEFLTLQEAAKALAVSIDVLLAWNDHNILKPTVTPTGEVGYRKEQIDHFLAIKRATTPANPSNFMPISPTPAVPLEVKVPETVNKIENHSIQNYSQVNNFNFYPQPQETIEKKNKMTFSFLGIVASFSFLAIMGIVIFFSQQNKLDAMLNEENLAYSNTNATINQTSSFNNQGKNKNNTNLNNEGYEVSKDKSSKLNKAFGKTNTTFASEKNNRDQATLLQSILGRSSDEKIREGIKSDDDIVTYGQRANFVRSSSCPNCSENSDAESTVFDTNGNIKVSKNDPSENELLATALGVTGVSKGQAIVRQNSSSATVFAFIILGFIALYFVHSTRRQLLPVSAKGHHNSLALSPVGSVQQIEKPKILELKQKTDGSVVTYFQGKEYKISKPELDSESDKFIERLMQLAPVGIKEIEYDALSDDKLALSAPLSKVVTRLGFVGLKRDLFFPRTSKTRVLFRRYITLDDLFAMNMTIDQISQELNPVN